MLPLGGRRRRRSGPGNSFRRRPEIRRRLPTVQFPNNPRYTGAMKSLLKILALVGAAAAVAWIGMYLHWSIKISGALATLKTQYPPNVIDRTQDPLKGEAFETLSAGGCRSLHSLAGSLD